jgi:HEAT repeat protein
MAVPLDPNTIVVLLISNQELDPRRATHLDEFYQEILRHLQSVPGLNVIRTQQVAPFLAAGALEEDIAREVGAAHLVVLSTSPDSLGLVITPLDVETGDVTGSMRFASPFDRRWPAELSSDAADVANFIREGLTERTPADRSAAIADARAIVLDSSLPPGERVEALNKLTQMPESRTDDIVQAAVELATIAPNLRASIWRAMYGVDNPYLIDPLINSLNYDDAEHRRRAAAAALATFVAEPRAKVALEQARASDTSETVREAALLALSTVDERQQLALQVLLDEKLPPRDRLAATIRYQRRNDREVTLTAEAAQAIFDIGLEATDPGTRAMAWGNLGRNGADSPAFLPVLLDDLANHSYDEVRTMAVFALRHYSEESEVRAALERAANDRSIRVRAAARTVLGQIEQ